METEEFRAAVKAAVEHHLTEYLNGETKHRVRVECERVVRENIQRAIEELGLKEMIYAKIARAVKKWDDANDFEFTERQIAQFQRVLDDQVRWSADQYVRKLAEQRAKKMYEIVSGEIFTGPQS